MVNVSHDAGQLGLSGGKIPAATRSVLLHLQCGGSHTTSVSGLTGGVKNPGGLEVLHSLGGGGHVGALSHHTAAVTQQAHCGVAV